MTIKNLYKKHYVKAVEILDSINELMSDIDWDVMESLEDGRYDEKYHDLLDMLYHALEDTESELSDNLYDTDLQTAYDEIESEERK